METNHLNAGGLGSLPLVVDDADRFRLIEAIAAAFGHGLLAYCVMDTHLHVLVAEAAEPGRLALARALVGYARVFNRRHAPRRALLRGPVVAVPVPSGPDGLVRAIRYLHENPVRTRPPLAARAIDFRWSSARAYGGLSLASAACVERVLRSLGPLAERVGRCPPLADLTPAVAPSAAPGLLLAAAAEAHGVSTAEVISERRAPRLGQARALFVRLARLEGYSVTQVAPLLGRSPAQAYRLPAGDVADRDVAVARTLLRDDGLRRTLPEVRLPLAGDARDARNRRIQARSHA